MGIRMSWVFDGISIEKGKQTEEMGGWSEQRR